MEKTQSNLDKYVSREFRIIMAVLAAAGIVYTMILVPLGKLESNYDYIKNNDLRHIEDNTNTINKRLDDNDTEHKKIEQQLERLITLQEAANIKFGAAITPKIQD
jgi:hypothetical protein